MMAKTRGTGLLMVWTDIDEEHEAEFNRWYDEEHLARLLAVPGFLGAGRYVALKGGPKYLAICELEDHNVLRSAANLDAVKYQPCPSAGGPARAGPGATFCAMPIARYSRCTPTRSSRRWGWRRCCRWGG